MLLRAYILILLCLPVFVYGQTYTYPDNPNGTQMTTYRGGVTAMRALKIPQAYKPFDSSNNYIWVDSGRTGDVFYKSNGLFFRLYNSKRVDSIVAAGGGGTTGVTSFNGRTGIVMPQAIDYAAFYQMAGNYEVTSNKATTLSGANNTTYPTTLAALSAINTAVLGLIPYSDSAHYITPFYLNTHIPLPGYGVSISGQRWDVDSSKFATVSKVNALSATYLKLADTGNMLAPYAKSYQAVKYTDTPGLIVTKYDNDTAKSAIRGQISSGSADSTKFSTVYRNDTGNANGRAYSASLSAQGVKYTDTMQMLAGYERKGDSGVYATRYYVDTAKLNIRNSISGIPTVDSGKYSTVYRNDTGNRNLRTQIAGLPLYDSTVMQTKYRSDTGRANTYSAIAGKQPQLNGTGFVKASGTTITYDNSTYLTGNQTISLTATGDATGSASGTTSITIPLTLASKGTAGTYGSSTSVPVITTDGQGRVTNVTPTAINFPATDSTVYQTKYRSDTGRNNTYAAIASKGSGTVTGVYGIAPVMVSSASPTPTVSVVYSTTPTANTLAAWDANKNMSANNFLAGYTTVTSAATTTTLTATSPQRLLLNGSTYQTFQMPVTSTLPKGVTFTIYDSSSDFAYITSSGGSSIGQIEPGCTGTLLQVNNTTTGATDWVLNTSIAPYIIATKTGNSTFVLPKGQTLQSISFLPTSNGTVSVGTTSGGTDIVSNQSITTTSPTTFSKPTLVSFTANATIYITTTLTYTYSARK